MMSLCRNLAVLLLFLTPDPFLRFSSPLLFAHAVPTSPPITLPPILFVTGGGTEDYEDVLDRHSPPPVVPSSAKPPLHRETQLCQYDSCLENQEPCTRLAAQTGCLCPGFSGPEEPPHAPHLKALVSDGDGGGKVEVHWCAPSSAVSGYRVVVEGSGREPLEFGEAMRRGLVGSLEAGAKVCVEAVNKVGHSTPSEFSCQRYTLPDSSDHALRAGVIGGGVAFLLVLCVAAVILWKYQVCGKSKRDSTEGLGNPSYATEGNL
ncbi:LRRN4 C-terminal-like protein [Centroberyx gerrardi]